LQATIADELSNVTRQMFIKKMAAWVVADSALLRHIMANDPPPIPSLSEMVRDAQQIELDPIKRRQRAARSWASIGRNRFERPGGI
jgi:hypothetical protein